MLERLVQQDVPARVRALEVDLPGEEALPPHAGPLQLDPAPQRKLDQDAPAQPRRDAIVPERGVAFLVLQAQQQDLEEELFFFF